jgi:hypothetical protein
MKNVFQRENGLEGCPEFARAGGGFNVPEKRRGGRTDSSLETKETKCGSCNPVGLQRRTFLVGLADRIGSVETQKRGGNDGFLNVVHVVKGCREKAEKSFRVD